ncbi:MAG: hypothetical protein H7X77_04995, partial [Anaerolineae bacterium]|nr:hypothetical protein [Anaerolineae bacterium]
DIIPVLIDEFYAGVGAQTGAAVLEIIGQIGGYQATQLFFELVADSSTMPCWREVAERWLHQDEML